MNADINHIGNFRFIGATDNIRGRAEQPASYFARLKAGGIEIRRHLLVEEFADDPSLLEYSASGYFDFRDRRTEKIWEC